MPQLKLSSRWIITNLKLRGILNSNLHVPRCTSPKKRTRNIYSAGLRSYETLIINIFSRNVAVFIVFAYENLFLFLRYIFHIFQYAWHCWIFNARTIKFELYSTFICRLSIFTYLWDIWSAKNDAKVRKTSKVKYLYIFTL